MKRFCSILAVVTLALPGTLSYSDPGNRKPRHLEGGPGALRVARLAQALDLSAQQREQLRGIVRDRRAVAEGGPKEALDQARRQLGTVVHDPAADEQQVIDAAQKLSDEAVQMALGRHRMFVEIAGILSEEQLEQAKQLFEERMERPGRFRGGQGRSGGRPPHPRGN